MNIKSSIRNFAMKPLRGYKKYVSPYNDIGTHCKYTPTCSLYAADSIKEYGLLEGTLRGGLRILRCDGKAKGGYDPVPKKGEAFPEAEDFLYEHPPVEGHSCLHNYNAPSSKDGVETEEIKSRSLPRKILDKALVFSMQVAGAVAGGVSGATAGIVAGTAGGGYIGLRAGKGELGELRDSILEKYVPPRYRDDEKKSLELFEKSFGGLGKEVHDFISEKLHSPLLGKIIGTPVGLVTGGVIGFIGGAFMGAGLGIKMGETMGKNYMKDKLGILPKIPGQEELLEHYQ